MIRFLLLLTFCASAYSADHNLFKNCTRVPFCAKLRNLILDNDSQFAANVSGFKVSHNIVNIPLTNNLNESLQLNITLLPGEKLRIKVLENDHTRYELLEALDGEPTPLLVTDSDIHNVTNTSLTISKNDSKLSVIVTQGPPFSVSCYYEENLEAILRGDRLIMENSNDSQAFTFGVDFSHALKLYGLYHHAYQLALGKTVGTTSDPFRLRNSDTSDYEVGSPMALYGSIPVVYGHSTVSTSGIFLNNAAEQWVDVDYLDAWLLSGTVYFMVESGTFDLFVLLGPTLKDVVRQYTNLTGVAHLPQLWTLGYHQSRWSYLTQEDVKEVVANMNTYNFPLDAIWLDIDYTDGKRYFTWNPENFNDPIELQKNISSSNKKLVTILDPHLKVDENYPVYVGGKEFYVKWQNGSDFQGYNLELLEKFLEDARNIQEERQISADEVLVVEDEDNAEESEEELPYYVGIEDLRHGGLPPRH